MIRLRHFASLGRRKDLTHARCNPNVRHVTFGHPADLSPIELPSFGQDRRSNLAVLDPHGVANVRKDVDNGVLNLNPLVGVDRG